MRRKAGLRISIMSWPDVTRFNLKVASPLEGEVGPKVRVGGNGAAFSQTADLLSHTPHPSMLRIADLPLKGGGDWKSAMVGAAP